MNRGRARFPRAVIADRVQSRVSTLHFGDVIPPWARMGPYRLAYSSVVYSERETTKMVLNGSLFELREGTGVLVPTGSVADVDSAFVVEDARLRSRWWSLGFEGDPTGGLLDAPSDVTPFEIPPERRRRFVERFRDLREELAAVDAHDRTSVQALLTLVAVDVRRVLGKAGAMPDRPLVGRFFSYVRDNLGENLTLSDIAGALGFRPSYFTDVIRRETGLPAMAWVREFRIREAEKLLGFTERSVEDIAVSVGYADVRAFRRSFVDARGASPGDWRRRRSPASLPCAGVIVRDQDGFHGAATGSPAKTPPPLSKKR